MYKFVLFLSVGALMMGGCTTGNDSDSSGDTGRQGDHPPTVAGFEESQADTGGTASYTVNLDGWADAVLLDITENSDNPWAESHDLNDIDWTTVAPFTDTWGIDLPVVESCNDQTNNVNTCFKTSTEAHMVWMFTAYVSGVAIDCGYYAYDTNLGVFGKKYDCVEFKSER